MWQLVLAAFFMVGTAACTNSPAKWTPIGDSSSFRTSVKLRTLPIGTRIAATIRSEVASDTHHAEETVEAIVTYSIYDLNGLMVLPRGSTVLLTIIALESAHGPGNLDGRVSLGGNAVTLESASYAVIARIDSTPYALVARVTAHAAPAGVATAGRYSDRDVVVAAGTPIVLTLTQPLSVWPK